MRTKIFHLNKENQDYCGFASETKRGTNRAALMRKADLLKKVISEDMTERQRLCITEHILNGRKQKEIAEILGLSPSTVSRHIAAGKRRLHYAAKLISNDLNDAGKSQVQQSDFA